MSAKSLRYRNIFAVVSLCFALLFLFLAESAVASRRRAERAYFDVISSAAEEFSLPFPLLYAVIREESDFQEDAVSNAGAVGLMQLLPDTYLFIGKELLGENPDPSKIGDAAVNIRYGACYLSYLLQKFPVPATALAAYNAGEGRVADWLADETLAKDGVLLEIPFSETKNYVAKVTRSYRGYCKKYHVENKLNL